MASKGPRSGSGDDELDVREALKGLVPPSDADDVDVSAGFFHRTLARWLGLPEGRQPARKKASPPLWDYDLWKAELTFDGDGDGHADDDDAGAADSARRNYTARIFRTDDGAPEVVRYWVKLDGAGRIKQSGWLTPAPVLFDEGPPSRQKTSPGLDAAMLQRLFSEVE